MNETQALQLINAVNDIAKEVAENRRQINELLQEVGRLKDMVNRKKMTRKDFTDIVSNPFSKPNEIEKNYLKMIDPLNR